MAIANFYHDIESWLKNLPSPLLICKHPYAKSEYGNFDKCKAEFQQYLNAGERIIFKMFNPEHKNASKIVSPSCILITDKCTVFRYTRESNICSTCGVYHSWVYCLRFNIGTVDEAKIIKFIKTHIYEYDGIKTLNIEKLLKVLIFIDGTINDALYDMTATLNDVATERDKLKRELNELKK